MLNASTDIETIDDSSLKRSNLRRGFIEIQWDVTDSTLRTLILKKVRRFGFARRTLSVYYGRYSEELLQDLDTFVQQWTARRGKTGLCEIIVSKPKYDDDEYKLWEDRYEAAFRAEFERIQKVFVRISHILEINKLPKHKVTNEENKEVWEIDATEFEHLYGCDPETAHKNGWLYKDREDGALMLYTGNQVMTMVRDVKITIEDLKEAISSRMKYESNTATPELKQSFEELEQRLERDSAYATTLADTIAKRTSKLVHSNDSNQTTIDQSDNKGFTEQ